MTKLGALEISKKAAKQAGFTLIELSIVLVIIGLIVGGVLVGQDLIKAAEIRATIGQLEKYDAAANTFRNKYNGYPGDERNGANFFAATTDVPDTTTHCTGAVPGNAVLEDCAGTHVLLSGEPAAFWRQLYLANMIADPITDTNLVGGTTAAVAAPTNIGNAFPVAKVGGFIMMYTGGSALTQAGFPGANLYRVGGIASFSTAAPTLSLGLTPLEALAIDAKKDDGVPGSGIVQASDVTASSDFNVAADKFTAGTDNTTCVNGAAYTGSNNKLCNLIIRASF